MGANWLARLEVPPLWGSMWLSVVSWRRPRRAEETPYKSLRLGPLEEEQGFHREVERSGEFQAMTEIDPQIQGMSRSSRDWLKKARYVKARQVPAPGAAVSRSQKRSRTPPDWKRIGRTGSPGRNTRPSGIGRGRRPTGSRPQPQPGPGTCLHPHTPTHLQGPFSFQQVQRLWESSIPAGEPAPASGRHSGRDRWRKVSAGCRRAFPGSKIWPILRVSFSRTAASGISSFSGSFIRTWPK